MCEKWDCRPRVNREHILTVSLLGDHALELSPKKIKHEIKIIKNTYRPPTHTHTHTPLIHCTGVIIVVLSIAVYGDPRGF